jgi:hypothetical protein
MLQLGKCSARCVCRMPGNLRAGPRQSTSALSRLGPMPLRRHDRKRRRHQTLSGQCGSTSARQAALYALKGFFRGFRGTPGVGWCSKEYWGLSPRFADELQRMAFADPDPTVRDIALIGLTECYSSTNDSRISRLLADVTSQESFPTDVRKNAYFCLYGVRGLPTEVWPRVWSAGFRFPEDVDWSFVKSFREAEKQGGRS